MIINRSHQLGSEKDSSDNKDILTAGPPSLKSSYKKGIPLIPLNEKGGMVSKEEISKCEPYITPSSDGADYLFTVRGTSMLPAFKPGDIVACKSIPSTGFFFQWNNIYVMDTLQGVLVKRVKPGKDKKHILIVSDDNDYNPFELSCSDICSITLIVGVMRLMA